MFLDPSLAQLSPDCLEYWRSRSRDVRRPPAEWEFITADDYKSTRDKNGKLSETLPDRRHFPTPRCALVQRGFHHHSTRVIRPALLLCGEFGSFFGPCRGCLTAVLYIYISRRCSRRACTFLAGRWVKWPRRSTCGSPKGSDWFNTCPWATMTEPVVDDTTRTRTRNTRRRVPPPQPQPQLTTSLIWQ